MLRVLLHTLQVQSGVVLGCCNAGSSWGFACWGKPVIIICTAQSTQDLQTYGQPELWFACH
jgi:hypothetical protein